MQTSFLSGLFSIKVTTAFLIESSLLKASFVDVRSAAKDCSFLLSYLEKARNCDVATRWNLVESKEDLSWGQLAPIFI